MSNIHKLDGTIKEGLEVNGKTYWLPAIALPMFTTKGLSFWKRFSEKNWRPQCDCGEIFDSMDAYKRHYYKEAQEL